MQAFGNINSKTFCHYFAQEISVTTQYFGTYRHMSVLLFREKSKLLLPIPRSSFELSVGGRFGQNSSSSLITNSPNKPTVLYLLIVSAPKNLVLRIQKYSPNIFPWLPHQPCTAVLHLPVSFLWPFCQLYVLPFCQWSCNCLLFFYRKCILAAGCNCTSVQSCFPLWGDVPQIRHHSSPSSLGSPYSSPAFSIPNKKQEGGSWSL